MPLKNLKYILAFLAGGFLLGTAQGFGQDSKVDVSTATGDKINYDDNGKTVVIEGHAKVVTASATLSADTIRLNNQTKMAEAEKNVAIKDKTSTLKGQKAIYFWEVSTGTIYDARGASPPWYFLSEKMYEVDRNTYRLLNGGITSCDLDPPHYLIRFSRAKMINRQRANLQNPKLAIGDSDVFWSPFLSKSLVPKKWSYRLEPGANSRDGFVLKNTFGYPLTNDSKIFLRYDWLEYTGHGAGAEYFLTKPLVTTHLNFDYLRETPADPLPKRKRYELFWDHYQKLAKPLTLNSKVEYKTDANYSNDTSGVGNGALIEDQNRGLLSELGLNYQWKRAALRMDMQRQDKYDSNLSSEAFISALVLPMITFNTIPIKFRVLPFYTSFQAFWKNATPERSSPNVNLVYQRSADVNTRINRDFRFKKTTLTPSLTYDETWQSSESSGSSKEVYQGRYSPGLNWRQRLTRSTDFNAAYTFTMRLEKNRTNQDLLANDRGVEQNTVSPSFVSRWGRNNRWSLSSAYDLRSAPRSNPDFYKSRSARISPLNLDSQMEIRPRVTLFYRESYSFYDSSNRKPVKTPVNSSGEIQWGDPNQLVFFSQGFNHSKTPTGQEPSINLTNKLKFFPSRKWYIDFYLSYRLITDHQFNKGSFTPNEKTIQVVRDLHCWIFRMVFSQRPDRTEASFYIDLKSNISTTANIFANTTGTQAYPYRNSSPPLSDIFPQ